VLWIALYVFLTFLKAEEFGLKPFHVKSSVLELLEKRLEPPHCLF